MKNIFSNETFIANSEFFSLTEHLLPIQKISNCRNLLTNFFSLLCICFTKVNINNPRDVTFYSKKDGYFIGLYWSGQ